MCKSRVEKPIFVKRLRDKTCLDGDLVTFVCEVKAVSAPQITWYKDGKIIQQDEVRANSSILLYCVIYLNLM